MKTLSVTILIICFLGLSAFSQSKLNVSTKGAVIGRNLTYEISDIKTVQTCGKKIKGNFKVVNNTSLCSGKDTIPIEKVEKLWVKNNMINLRNGIITGVGGVFTVLFSVVLVSGYTSKDSWSVLAAIIFTPPALVCYGLTSWAITKSVNGRKFKASNRKFEIKN